MYMVHAGRLRDDKNDGIILDPLTHTLITFLLYSFIFTIGFTIVFNTFKDGMLPKTCKIKSTFRLIEVLNGMCEAEIQLKVN